MDFHDQIPIVLSHLGKGFVSEDSSVVDQHVNTAESVDGGLDDVVTILNAVVVSNCITPLLLPIL